MLQAAIVSPQEGQVLSAGAVRVKVEASPDAVLAINGEVAQAQMDGTFAADLFLEEGPNLIELIGADVTGAMTSQEVVVFLEPQAAGPALDVTYPADGYITSEPSVNVIGSASHDAVVAINGLEVPINELGIFEGTVGLESGPNLIEVLAVDVNGETVSTSIIVFFETPGEFVSN